MSDEATHFKKQIKSIEKKIIDACTEEITKTREYLIKEGNAYFLPKIEQLKQDITKAKENTIKECNDYYIPKLDAAKEETKQATDFYNTQIQSLATELNNFKFQCQQTVNAQRITDENKCLELRIQDAEQRRQYNGPTFQELKRQQEAEKYRQDFYNQMKRQNEEQKYKVDFANQLKQQLQQQQQQQQQQIQQLQQQQQQQQQIQQLQQQPPQQQYPLPPLPAPNKKNVTFYLGKSLPSNSISKPTRKSALKLPTSQKKKGGTRNRNKKRTKE
jgi:hypothetical protein